MGNDAHNQLSCIHTVSNRVKNSDNRLTYSLQINNIYRISADRTNFPMQKSHSNVSTIAFSLELTFASTRGQHMMVKAQITWSSKMNIRKKRSKSYHSDSGYTYNAVGMCKLRSWRYCHCLLLSMLLQIV